MAQKINRIPHDGSARNLLPPQLRGSLRRITALPKAPIGDVIAPVSPVCKAGPMCHRCDAIDVQIKRYRVLESHLSDPQTLRGLTIQIRILNADKALIHHSPET